MALRFSVAIGLACAVLASVSTGATAQRAETKCDELLTLAEAKGAMHESDAAVIRKQLKGHTRTCDFYGGHPGAPPTHVLGVDWGPYGEARKRELSWGKKHLCHVKKDACKLLKEAVNAKSNLRSFALFAKTLSKVGLVQRLHSFGGNPAFLWHPGAKVSPADELAWVEVYDVSSRHELQTLCGDRTDTSPDTPCAVTAAEHAFENVSP